MTIEMENQIKHIAEQINALPNEERSNALVEVIRILANTVRYEGLSNKESVVIPVDKCGCDRDGDIFIYHGQQVYINLRNEFYKGYAAGSAQLSKEPAE